MPVEGRLLVVDDEPDILVALKAYLEGALGVSVTTAESGALGLALVKAETWDLVISDFRMPGMDGLEFLRQVHALRPSLSTVLLTAFPDMRIAIEAVNQAHIAQFLVKPVDPERLAELVGALVSRSRLGRQRQAALQRSLDVERGRSTPDSP